MENKNRKTFFMFLMAFLVAFFIVSLVEVLRSSLIPSGAPEIPVAAAIEGTVPASFSSQGVHRSMCHGILRDPQS